MRASATESSERFDFIVAGAGSAGSVLAARLSACGRFRVLLLEAGPTDHHPWIQIPVGVTKLFTNPSVNWCFETEPVAALDGRCIYQPRGKVLGGTSSINGMVYMRGTPADYDGWRQRGCTGWDWQSVLPYFKKSQHQARGSDALHGVDGPLNVSDIVEPFALSRACVAAAIEAGIPANNDFNGPEQEGTGFYQFTIASNGRRASASRAFLDRTARNRSNLEIVTQALAERIVIEEGRAVGIVYERHGEQRTAYADAEVIVAGGVFGSPQLLQLSGIGPGDVLQQAGVPVNVERASVGRNLHDHFNVHLTYKCTGASPVTLNDLAHSPSKRLRAGLQYALTGRGLLATSGVCAGVFTRTDPRLETPDLQINLLLYSSAGRAESGILPHPFSAFAFSLVHLRSESRGCVSITGPRASQAPSIEMNFLSTEYERRAMIEAMRIGRRIGAQPSLAAFVEREILPGPNVASDEEVLADLRARGLANYHPVGTCRMGGDPDAVVDPRLRVNGVTNLRIADASIMPQIPSGNTNAPSIMIGEKAADMILADARMP
ncbi:MAG: GMC family oxidoreductase [Hyphomicrobiaceae bacterium]